MENKTIYHQAEVSEIENDSVVVEVNTMSACAGCHAKSACTLSNQSKKTIKIKVDNPNLYKKTQEVTVALESKYGYWSVFYAYILPLILVLSTLLIGVKITNNELTSGIYSIIILIPYYLIIFLCQKTLTKKFNFKIIEK